MWNGRDNNSLKITRSFARGGSHRARNGGRGNFSVTAIAAALKMCRSGSVLLGHRNILSAHALLITQNLDDCIFLGYPLHALKAVVATYYAQAVNDRTLSLHIPYLNPNPDHCAMCAMINSRHVQYCILNGHAQ